jgi:hypothetical protein
MVRDWVPEVSHVSLKPPQALQPLSLGAPQVVPVVLREQPCVSVLLEEPQVPLAVQA